MDWETFQKHKSFAGEKKPSMKRRDIGHDYTERHMYMITMEVEGRLPLFGRLTGNAFAERGSSDEPRIVLTPLGEAVQREWMGIHGYYPQIEVKAVQMMPDHMHGILFVMAPLPVHLGQVISGFKAGCRKAQRLLTQMEAMSTATEPLYTGEGMQASQYMAAQPSAKHGGSLFAKGYNDLILRSYEEYQHWENYLRDNPRRLLKKRARPNFLRPFFNWQIGSWTYNGIGNRQLLAASWRQNVLISNHHSPKELEAEVNRYVADAKAGCVLVSPAISKGEKCVMRTVFNMKLPTVVVMRNGFTPLSKPKGEQFDACADGRLLMLSAWPHINERIKLTRWDCTQMNLMAQELSRLDIDCESTNPLTK